MLSGLPASGHRTAPVDAESKRGRGARAAGDLAAVARRVDHWVYFSTKRSRASFARVAARAGFTVEDAINSPADEHGFGARVHRSDIVELAHIHSVVMHLVELAGQHQGDYDGWETSVEKTLR